MRTIIAGSRTLTDLTLVEAAIEASGFRDEITEVVSGAARGVDKLGEEWARVNSIPVKIFLAEWNQYGRRAGPLRNEVMGEYADALIAIPHGESRGTRHMIEVAGRRGLRVFVYEV